MKGIGQKRKILVIGLDMGDGSLVHKWAEEGYLSTFNRMIKEGVWGYLRTSAEVLHVSSWPSLYTGTFPGKHGVYYTFQPEPGLQGTRRIGPDPYGQPPVWEILDTADEKCIIMDAPYTYPVKDFRGIQIFEWGTWAWYWRPMTMPEKVWNHLQTQCGPYPLGFEANQVGLASLDLEKLKKGLIAGASSKAKVARWLLEQNPWDMAWVVFGETHAAGHYLWEPIGASPSSMIALREVYQAVDTAIDEILRDLGEDLTVFVVSGDGVGPNHAGWHLLPEVLERAGFTRRKGSFDRDVSSAAENTKQVQKDLLKRIRDLIPKEIRQAISRKLPAQWRDSLMTRWVTTDIDWTQSKAYCLPTDLEGCIRINLKGREPNGIVQPGAEYKEVLDEITSLLETLINPLTGQPAVRQVLRMDQVFPGGKRDYLPDLIVKWADESEIRELKADGIGLITGPSPDARVGTHRPPGFIVAKGPFIKQGQTLSEMHIVDLAPTLLAHFEIPVPQSMDGRVWEELLVT